MSNRLILTKRNWELYLMIALPMLYIIIFKYIPMWGVQIAFKNYTPIKGIWGSDWVGVKHFLRFFGSYKFSEIVINTLLLSFYLIIAGFPVPILLAILLNYCQFRRYGKFVQMVTYAPFFISTVSMVGIIHKLFAARIGLVNILLSSLGLDHVDWLGNASIFPHLYVWTDIWQQMGWNSIIFLAVLSGVDPSLHESAKIDGAGIIMRIRHIDIPYLVPTAVILLILRVGSILDIGFEKIFLMQNNLNIGASEVISTYVYKLSIGSARPNFSYATAIGLFQSVVGFFLLLFVNRVVKKAGSTSLW